MVKMYRKVKSLSRKSAQFAPFFAGKISKVGQAPAFSAVTCALLDHLAAQDCGAGASAWACARARTCVCRSFGSPPKLIQHFYALDLQFKRCNDAAAGQVNDDLRRPF
jgi:hypothetical protein